MATPEELSVAVPSSAEPFRKLTVPAAGEVLPLPLHGCGQGQRLAGSDWIRRRSQGCGRRLWLERFHRHQNRRRGAGEEAGIARILGRQAIGPGSQRRVVNVATPEAFRVAVPSGVEPLMKLTVPVAGAMSRSR